MSRDESALDLPWIRTDAVPALEWPLGADRACVRRPGRFDPDWTVDAMAAAVAAAVPGREAVVASDGRWTHGALDAAASQVSEALRRAGVRAGDVVAVVPIRARWTPALLLGVWRAGASFVPLSADAPIARTAAVLRRARPVGMVIDARNAADRLDRLVGAARRTGVPVALASDPDAFAEAFGEPWADPPDETAVVTHGPDDPAYTMFTSGSSGDPKGVTVSHRGIARLLDADFLPSPAPRRWLQFAPYAFDASTLELWAGLLHGGAIVLPPEGPLAFDDLTDLLREEAVDTAWMTAGFFHAAVRTVPELFAPLRTLLCGGDVVSPVCVRDVLAGRDDLVVVDGYGPTENTVFTCCHRVTAEDLESGGPLPIGAPIAHGGVAVADADGRILPIGAEGELLAFGSGVAIGYLGDPERTERQFVHHPELGVRVYRTGDQATVRGDGVVVFHGRADDEVKIRGYRVDGRDVADAIRQIDGVLGAEVVATRTDAGPRLDAVVAVGVAPNGGTAGEARAPGDRPATLDEPALRARLAAVLSPEAMPVSIVFTPTLPLTANGKPDRRRVRAMIDAAAHHHGHRGAQGARPAADDRLADTDAHASGTSGTTTAGGRTESLAAAVTAAWADVLGRTPTAEDDFFSLGGDSLRVLELAAILERTTGVRLTLGALYQDPRLCAHIDLLEERRGDASARPGDAIDPTAADGASTADAPNAGAAVDAPAVDAPGVEATAAQRTIAMLELMSPHRMSYTVRWQLRWEAPIATEVVRAAVEALVDRHAALRTAVVRRGGTLVLEPRRRASLPPIEIEETTIDAGADPSADVAERMHAFAARPFDAASPPGLRVQIVRDGTRATSVHLVAHHVAVDGLSMAVLADAVAADVDASLHGAAADATGGSIGAERPAPTTVDDMAVDESAREDPVLDYARSDAARRASAASAAATERMAERLVAHGSALGPDAAADPAARTADGRFAIVASGGPLDGETAGRPRPDHTTSFPQAPHATSSTEITSPGMPTFTELAAAFAAALATTQSRPDVLLGLIVADRRPRFGRPRVGMHARTVPARIVSAADATPDAVGGAIRRALADADGDLAAALRTARQADGVGRVELDALVTHLDLTSTMREAGRRRTVLGGRGGMAEAGLVLVAWTTSDRTRLEIEYDVGLWTIDEARMVLDATCERLRASVRGGGPTIVRAPGEPRT